MLQLTCSPIFPRTRERGCTGLLHTTPFIHCGRCRSVPSPLAVGAMRPTSLQRVSALPLDNALACQDACCDVAVSALVEEWCLGAWCLHW